MGIFDKIKRGVSDAQAAGALAAQSAANAQPGTGQVGVSGMAGPHINPAHFGGPSTTALNAATFTRAANEWIARMGKSMVVGQQFRSHLGI